MLIWATRTCSGPAMWVSLVGVKVQVALGLSAQNCLRVAAWAWAWSPLMVTTVPALSLMSRVVPLASVTNPLVADPREAVEPSPPPTAMVKVAVPAVSPLASRML